MFFPKFLFNYLVRKKIKKVIDQGNLKKLTNYIYIGKALRSSLVYKIAKQNQFSLSYYKKAISCSALLELLHNVSIIHDDIIDGEIMRRNEKTLNKTLGLFKSTFVGDFFFLSSFKFFFEDNKNEVIQKEIIKKTKLLCLGEIQQDEEVGKITQIPEKKKLIQIVKQKTGSLFSLSCTLPYLIGENNQKNLKFAEQCGFFYGIVYQVLDDVFDIQKDLSFFDNKDFFRHWTLPILILQQDYNDYFLMVIKQNQNIPNFIYEKIIEKCFIELNQVFDGVKKKIVTQKNKKILKLIVDDLNFFLIKKDMKKYCFKI